MAVTRRALHGGTGATLLVVGTSLLSVPVLGRKSGGDKDCKHFSTQKKAQKFFKKNGGPNQDPHGLDGDGDGIACESLP